MESIYLYSLVLLESTHCLPRHSFHFIYPAKMFSIYFGERGDQIRMTFPRNFDQNEWFVIVSLIIFILIVRFLPKRFPTSITILIMAFSITIARAYDHLLSLPKLELYDVMDSPTFEIFDLFVYVLYAPIGYLFNYFLEKLNINGPWIALYIFFSSVCGTLFEWLCDYFNVFTYKGWHLSYSFTTYLITQGMTLIFFKYIYKVHAASTKKQNTST